VRTAHTNTRYGPDMTIDPSTERFDLPITIAPDDIDELGHVNNVVYLRWVQEVATAHWRSAATETQIAEIAWVVVRHEIDYKTSARPGDEIIARTWVGTADEFQFERLTEIRRKRDDRVLASARTLWCPIRIQTGRPARVDADIRNRFSTNVQAGSSANS
jgi:acyl-CoA thioester hydrolase